jgi:hypothetical protein
MGLIPSELAGDPQFQADIGPLQADIANRYAGYARQLGYNDPTTGLRLPGSIELDTQRALADYARQRLQAIQNITNEEQQRGTLWSGVRGLHQGLAESPILTNMADAIAGEGTNLGTVYQALNALGGEFSGGIRQAVLDATARRVAAINAAQSAAAQPTDTGAGVVTDPSQVSPSNPTLMTAAGPITYATAETAATSPSYGPGVDIPALPGATGDVGGGAMRAGAPTQPAVATPPPNPQVSQPAAMQPMQQAATQQATHQISVKTPTGQTITHKVVAAHPISHPLIRAVAKQVAQHMPPPKAARGNIRKVPAPRPPAGTIPGGLRY